MVVREGRLEGEVSGEVIDERTTVDGIQAVWLPFCRVV